jgi:hypothetical protein
MEAPLVQKQQGGQDLILGGGGHVGEELLDFSGIHLPGVFLVMAEDEAFDPIDLGFLTAEGVVSPAQGMTDLIEQFGGMVFHFGLHSGASFSFGTTLVL